VCGFVTECFVGEESISYVSSCTKNYRNNYVKKIVFLSLTTEKNTISELTFDFKFFNYEFRQNAERSSKGQEMYTN